MTITKPLHIGEAAGNLADQGCDRIKRRIFDFDLMPGDRLSESNLTRQINVSRTPLRQALQRLQHEGFVEAIPKVGWLILLLNFETFDEVCDSRVLIECFAVRELCATAKERTEFQRLARLWQVPAKERLRDAVKVSVLDEAFHMQIVESTGNREMLRAYREITERIRIIRRPDFTKSERVSANVRRTRKNPVCDPGTPRRGSAASAADAHRTQQTRSAQDHSWHAGPGKKPRSYWKN